MTYGTWLSEFAVTSMLAVSESAYAKLDDAIRLLCSHPGLGVAYDPLYDAAKPPIPVRVLYVENYGIYYTIDDEHRLIRVHFIEDQRMDPNLRFTGRLG